MAVTRLASESNHAQQHCATRVESKACKLLTHVMRCLGFRVEGLGFRAAAPDEETHCVCFGASNTSTQVISVGGVGSTQTETSSDASAWHPDSKPINPKPSSPEPKTLNQNPKP